MNLVFFINYLNHHQIAIMDEFHSLLKEEFCVVVTQPRNESELKGGHDYCSRIYCISAGEDILAQNKAFELSRSADVCVFGACSQKYAVERAKHNPQGLSFEMGERWLKKGLINLLSPRFITWYYNYLRYYRKAAFYKLCCSGFAAKDDMLVNAYRERHFKWGYFVADQGSGGSILDKQKSNVQIMWCARFIDWKHPELVIELARRLKDEAADVHINMYGVGGSLEKIRQLSKDLNVEDLVSLKGQLPNSQIVDEMRNHDIFLFTSDRNEGWGVVLNEAMLSRCAVVASDEIGAVPFLLVDGEQGLTFKSQNIDSLYFKVKALLNSSELRKQLAHSAYEIVSRIWSPQKAAENFLQLITDLKNDRDVSVLTGPCSKVL